MLAVTNPGLDGMIVAPTWGLLHRVTLRAFYARYSASGACPREFVRRVNRSERYIELLNGSHVFYGSADRPETLEGTTLAWYWADEPRYYPEEADRVLVGRLRERRASRLRALYTSTPSSGWLQIRFSEARDDEHVVHCSSRENEAHLAPGFIEALQRRYSKRLERTLIEGHFGLAEHAVYGAFDWDKHGIAYRVNPELPLVGVVDFGRRRPFVSFWQSPRANTIVAPGLWALPGTWICVAELHPENATTEVLAKQCAALVRERKWRVAEWFCDPAGQAANVQTGLGDVDVFQQHGLSPISWADDYPWRFVPYGVELVDGLLENSLGETRLYVSRELERGGPTGIKASFENYHYPEPRDGQPLRDVPVKDGITEHAMDTVRYLATNTLMRSGGGHVPYGATR